MITFLVRSAFRGAVAASLVMLLVSCAASPDTPTSTSAPSGSSVTSDPGASIREYGEVTVRGAALPQYTADASDAAIGQPAPSLSGVDFTGSPVSIDPASGEPVLVVFVAHWCPHCQREVPRLVAWSQSTTSDLRVVLVSTAASEERDNWPASSWLSSEKWTGDVLVDDVAMTALNTYGMTGFPAFVAVGADGTVLDRATGELSSQEIDALVAKLGA